MTDPISQKGAAEEQIPNAKIKNKNKNSRSKKTHQEDISNYIHNI